MKTKLDIFMTEKAFSKKKSQSQKNMLSFMSKWCTIKSQMQNLQYINWKSEPMGALHTLYVSTDGSLPHFVT